MKKLLVLALASVSFFYVASVYAAADIKFEGDFRVRGIYADDLDANEDANDQTAFADGRFRLKTTATAGITSGVVVVDFTNAFTDPTNTGCNGPASTGCRTGNYRFGSANFGGSYGIVGVRQAYLAVDLNMVKFAFGRKPFVLGHSLVLDDTMDAIAAKFKAGPLDVLLANGKLIESTVSGVGGTGSDSDLYIAKFGLNHADQHMLGLFVTYLKDRPELLTGTFATTGDTSLWGLGVTADGAFGPLMVNFEVDLFNGENDDTGATPAVTTDLTGMNVLLGAGLKAGADLNVWLLYTTGQEAATASDPNPDTNVNGLSGNFVLGNILLNDNINSDREGQCASVGGARLGSGGASCIGGFGVTGIKVSAGFVDLGMKSSHTEVAVIWAQTTEDITGTDPVSGLPVSGSDLGIEIDLNHRHKLDDNVAVAVNLGYLLSGDAFEVANGTGNADNQMKGVITLNYMF
jgi:hypothetical protein